MRFIKRDRLTGRWLEQGAIRPSAVIKELVNGDKYEHIDVRSGEVRSYAVTKVEEQDGLLVVTSVEVMS